MSVARPTRWGNPHPVGKRCPSCGCEHSRAEAIDIYRRELLADPAQVALARRDLAGRDLACWCPLGEPCHADVLLLVANDPRRCDR